MQQLKMLLKTSKNNYVHAQEEADQLTKEKSESNQLHKEMALNEAKTEAYRLAQENSDVNN